MAHGAQEIGAVDGDAECKFDSLEGRDPQMPHVDFPDEEELAKRHPKMEAPADLNLEDFSDDSKDSVLKKGNNIAREIQAKVARSGRRRHEEEEMSPIQCIEQEKDEG